MLSALLVRLLYLQLSATGAAPASSQIPRSTSAKSPIRAVLPEELVRVEKKYASARTLRALFTQVNRSAIAPAGSRESSGKIYLERPHLVRWETLLPDPSLLVGKATQFLFYTPPFDEDERGQLVTKKASQVQSRLASALLAGDFSFIEQMQITQEAPHRFRLTPRKGLAGTVREATLEIEPASQLITRVRLQHHGGNSSDISLREIELGVSLSPSLFEMTVPPNTDRIGA